MFHQLFYERPEKQLRSFKYFNLYFSMEIVFFPLRCLPSCELVSEVVIVESYGYGWLLQVLVVFVGSRLY